MAFTFSNPSVKILESKYYTIGNLGCFLRMICSSFYLSIILQTEHWNMTRYLNMVLESDWHDDLDVARAVHTPRGNMVIQVKRKNVCVCVGERIKRERVCVKMKG